MKYQFPPEILDITEKINKAGFEAYLVGGCVRDLFLGPKFGISGIRKYTGIYNKPLLGGIVKPKTGVTPKILLEMVKELVDGGVNFIKEEHRILFNLLRRYPINFLYINTGIREGSFAIRPLLILINHAWNISQ